MQLLADQLTAPTRQPPAPTRHPWVVALPSQLPTALWPSICCHVLWSNPWFTSGICPGSTLPLPRTIVAAALGVLPSLSNKQNIGWNQDKKQDWDFLVCEAGMKKKKRMMLGLGGSQLHTLLTCLWVQLETIVLFFSLMLGQWERVHSPTVRQLCLSFFQRKVLSLYVATSCRNCSNCT